MVCCELVPAVPFTEILPFVVSSLCYELRPGSLLYDKNTTHKGWFFPAFSRECNCTQSSISTRPAESTLTFFSVSRAFSHQPPSLLHSLPFTSYEVTHRVVICVTGILKGLDDGSFIQRSSIIYIDLSIKDISTRSPGLYQ